MTGKIRFSIPEGVDFQKMFSGLDPQFRLDPGKTVRSLCTYFDTFDWRLYHAGLTLLRSKKELQLRSISTEDVVYSCPCPKQPVFAEDIDDHNLKERLLPIIEMRALLKILTATHQSQSFDIRNRDQKIIARIRFQLVSRIEARRMTTVASHFWLDPLRGYVQAKAKIEQGVIALGCSASDTPCFLRILEHFDIRPDDNSSKFQIIINPQISSDEAVRMIMKNLLKIMKITQPGIINDTDTEFLHDFRVSVRRTRSCLSQIKSVFPEDVTKKFKRNFLSLGKLTNKLRDLDVYLLNKAQFRSTLPDFLSTDIEPLFRNLEKERAKELKRVKRALNSSKCKKIFTEWESILDQPPFTGVSVDNAGVPIGELASARIYSKFQAVIKSGSQINDESEDELLHELRIECKKLRYLLEFFLSMYPPGRIKKLIDHLKRLQNNLGRFNDLCVQEKELQRFSRNLPYTGSESKRTFMAIGCLIEKFDIEKRTERRLFAGVFSEFNNRANKALYRELFVNPEFVADP